MSLKVQQRQERDTFARFVALAGIPVDNGSVVLAQPPLPDVVCNIGGIEYGFELTMLTDANLERQWGTGKFRYTRYRIDIEHAVQCILRKAEKPYSMAALDLVIHEGSTPLDRLWDWDPAMLEAPIQGAMTGTRFSRVWLVDFSRSIVRCYGSSLPKHE